MPERDNYIIILNNIKEDLNKWENIQCYCIKQFNIITISTLSKFIKSFVHLINIPSIDFVNEMTNQFQNVYGRASPSISWFSLPTIY